MANLKANSTIGGYNVLTYGDIYRGKDSIDPEMLANANDLRETWEKAVSAYSLAGTKLNATDNAVSASKLLTARTISVTGGATGSFTFDGSANVSVSLSVNNTTHNHDSTYLKLTGGTMTGSVNMPNNSGTTTANPTLYGFKVYSDSGGVTYGMNLITPSSNGNDWGTNVYGPNQGSRFIYFSKINTNSPSNMSSYDIKSKIALDTGELYVVDGTKRVYHEANKPSKTDVGLNLVDNTADSSKNVLSATKLTTARSITIGNTAKSFDGSANVAWSIAEVGALPLTGGTLTGLVTISRTNALALDIVNPSGGWSWMQLKSGTAASEIATNNVAIDGATAGSIHLRPSAGNANGSLMIQPNSSMRHRTEFGIIDIGSLNGSYAHFSTDRERFWFNKSIGVAGEIYVGESYNQRVYHAGFKPTSADVGAVSKTGDTMSGKLSVSVNGCQFGVSANGTTGNTTTTGKMNNFIEIVSDVNTSHNSSSGVVFHNRSTSTSALYYKNTDVNNGYFNFFSDDTNFDVRINENKVYHTGFKPTLSEIGAAPTSHTHTISQITGGTLGTLTLTANNTSGTYNTRAIELREVNNVTTSQSSDAYAPAIGFHWGGRFGKKLFMNASGVLTYDGEFSSTRTKNPAYNDYAEYFPKEDGYRTEAGDIIALRCGDGDEIYELAKDDGYCNSGLVVGVHSDEYGHLMGGEYKPDDFDGTQEEWNEKKYIPVGLVGRVYVKFKGTAIKGTMVVPSEIAGVGRAFNPLYDKDTRNVVGYIVENKDMDGIYKVRIKLGK